MNVTPFDQAETTLRSCLATLGRPLGDKIAPSGLPREAVDALARFGLAKAITTLHGALTNNNFPCNGQGPELVQLLGEAIPVLSKDGSTAQRILELASVSQEKLEGYDRLGLVETG